SINPTPSSAIDPLSLHDALPILGDEDLYNVFERVAFKVFEGLGHYREALLAAGATTAHLAGAGPALFAITRDEPAAKEIAKRIRSEEHTSELQSRVDLVCRLLLE